MVKFAPTIYEHLANVTGKTVSELAQNKDALIDAYKLMIQKYDPDIISFGLDVYNVEVEALGGKINYFEDNTLPALAGNVMESLDDLELLKNKNILKEGRIPMLLEAGKEVKKITSELGKTLLCAVTGPFTLASLLFGFENMVVSIIEEEDVHPLLSFAEEACYKFAEAFAEYGADIVINESYIAPPLLSLDMYKEYAFPYEKDLIQRLYKKGVKTVSLISGGNTELIVEDMLRTGTNLIMADAGCNADRYSDLCKKYGATLRANIASADLEAGKFDKIEKGLLKLRDDCMVKGIDLAIGAGIVSKDTPMENVLKFKDMFNRIFNS